MQKSFDRKLAAIHADPSGSREFILADAKDADMAHGVASCGRTTLSESPTPRHRTLAEFREHMRQVTRQGIVDIMLMSPSSNQVLTIEERLFDGSTVTPAARANDTTDVFCVRHNQYIREPSRPFCSMSIDHIQSGKLNCTDAERQRGADLGLYSVTFNNRLDEDLATLERYRAFREEAELKGFRHFLEVFDPNAPEGLSPEQVPGFVNDCIARMLAGVVGAGRPQFLKMVYHGPKSLEELVTYDPHLVVGVLGGEAGTTFDAFKLIADAQKYGARAALFGRKINTAECQLTFVEFLKRIVAGELAPDEAVKAYHGALERKKIKPHRALADDLATRATATQYGGGSSVSVPAGMPVAKAAR